MVTSATYVDWNLVYLEQHFLLNLPNHHEQYEFAFVVHNRQNYDFFQRLASRQREIRLPDHKI